MPTQADFERAAGDFDRSAAHVDELLTGPSNVLSGGVLVGGLLTFELHFLFDRVRLMLDRHADELRDLAATCRARAEACANYQVQMRAFEDASDAYQTDVRRWTSLSEIHEREPNLTPSPGPPPVAPAAPVGPPEWMTSVSGP
jgi:hypothetical protein